MDTKTLIETVEKIPYGKTREDHAEYRRRVSEAQKQWEGYLAAEHAYGYTPEQAALIFAKAWEDGHSEGYRLVESIYEELVEFLDKFRKAGA